MCEPPEWGRLEGVDLLVSDTALTSPGLYAEPPLGTLTILLLRRFRSESLESSRGSGLVLDLVVDDSTLGVRTRSLEESFLLISERLNSVFDSEVGFISCAIDLLSLD